MKVLVLSSLAYSLTNFRGALLREICANGHDVVAVAPDRNEAVERELAESNIGFRVIRMQRAGTNPLSDLRLLMSYIWLMLREKPDLVLAYTQKPIVYGGLAARILCIPRYYALMSGLGHIFSSHGRRRSLFSYGVARLYREAVRRARAIFVFNADDRADMISLGIISEDQNVVQVPGSGIDLERFAKQPVPEGKLCFLMICRLMRDKGIYEFAKAARQVREQHPDCEFQIVGHFETENPTGLSAAECERIERQYPVRFVGGTSDVRPNFANSSVFVLPSFYREGLPRTILEAMASGRPVITTDMPGCRDPIVEGRNGFLVPPQDANALAQAMLRFVRDDELARRMGEISRAIAEETYDVRKVNHLLIDEMDLVSSEHLAAAIATRSSLGAILTTATERKPTVDLDEKFRAVS